MRCLYLNLLLIVCLLFASCKEGNDSPSDLDKLEELELKPIMNLLTMEIVRNGLLFLWGILICRDGLCVIKIV